MLKALSENKLASSLIAAYVVAMTGSVITNMFWNGKQDTAHIAEVTRSKEVDIPQEKRITFAIKLALEAKEMAIKNGTAVGVHHNRADHP